MEIEKIREQSKKISKKMVSGIYFLLYKDVVVYVGKSVNMMSRINFHVSEGKKIFDSYTFLSIEDQNLLNEEEAKYIFKYTPKYNQTIDDSNYKYITKIKNKTQNKKIKINAVIIGNKLYVKKGII